MFGEKQEPPHRRRGATSWVEQQVVADDAGRVFDLFDTEGRFLGTFRLPFSLEGRVRSQSCGEGIIWGVMWDEVRTEYVVRGRVVKG